MDFQAVVRMIEHGPRLNPSTIEADHVPTDRGIYAWFDKKPQAPAYIGKATGSAGLRRRILKQHLNATYLETRQDRWTPEDAGQAAAGITFRGRPAVEKSAFRKNLARAEGLTPGNGTIRYICDSFELCLIPLPDLSGDEIRILESEAIQTYQPRLNRAGMSRRRTRS